MGEVTSFFFCVSGKNFYIIFGHEILDNLQYIGIGLSSILLYIILYKCEPIQYMFLYAIF